jgi:hypothetical protein
MKLVLVLLSLVVVRGQETYNGYAVDDICQGTGNGDPGICYICDDFDTLPVKCFFCDNFGGGGLCFEDTPARRDFCTTSEGYTPVTDCATGDPGYFPTPTGCSAHADCLSCADDDLCKWCGVNNQTGNGGCESFGSPCHVALVALLTREDCIANEPIPPPPVTFPQFTVPNITIATPAGFCFSVDGGACSSPEINVTEGQVILIRISASSTHPVMLTTNGLTPPFTLFTTGVHCYDYSVGSSEFNCSMGPGDFATPFRGVQDGWIQFTVPPAGTNLFYACMNHGTHGARINIIDSVPVISCNFPAGGVTSGGYPLHMNGRNFGNGTQATVLFNSDPVSILACGGTSCDVIVPEGDGGTMNVTVVLNDGDAGYGSFTYAAPVITAVNYASAPILGGSTITIVGEGFGQPSHDVGLSIKIGGKTCPITSHTHTVAYCTLPAGSGSGKSVRIDNLGQVYTLPAAVNYDTPAPGIVHTPVCVP